MDHNQLETDAPKKRIGWPLKVLCIVVGLLLGAYFGVCAFATFSSQIWPGTDVLGVNLGSLTEQHAADILKSELPKAEIALYLYNENEKPDRGETPDASASLASLGIQVDADAMAKAAYDSCRSSGFFSSGFRFLEHITGYRGYSILSGDAITCDPGTIAQSTGELADQLSSDAVDTTYRLGESAVYIMKAKDGRHVNQFKLSTLLQSGTWASDLTLDCPYTDLAAKEFSAQQVHDAIAGEMKNAGYDTATQSVTSEKTGVEFDVAEADSLLNEATPGDEVEVPAKVQYPTVTAEQLKEVLFRDVLGTYTTHVGGTSARINNVKLASAAVDGTVLNAGDVFSYNDVVGQRTEARGYQPAPAYVGGDTVDEIGGGVCQPSSTLYLATLLANLQIVTRAAHRYVPAYMPKGMDATVSWGGPEYRFANDTDYPVKIVAVFKKNYLTMTLYGTKIDDTLVKMTNKVLSTTPSKVIYQEDDSLPAGTQQVKQTAYTGYKVETYRNLYDGNGNLISSKLEAVTNYKVRDKIILVGPKAAETGAPTDEIPSDTATPTTPTTPATPTPPTTPTTPDDTQPSGDEGANPSEAGTTPGTDTGTDTPPAGDAA